VVLHVPGSGREICPASFDDTDQFININIDGIANIVTAGCSCPLKGR
jgi:hypothetical protein